MTEDKNETIRDLAKEIVDDIEAGRLSAEGLILKSTRLAMLTQIENFENWMNLEKYGFGGDDFAQKKMLATNRIIEPTTTTPFMTKPEKFHGSLDSIEKLRDSFKTQRQTRMNAVPFNQYEIAAFSVNISKLERIITTVRALIHHQATIIYNARTFTKLNSRLFESYQQTIDSLLEQFCSDVLAKIPAVYKRLNDGDAEAVSHALTSCRRMIDSFADAVYPPSAPIKGDNGQEILLDSSRTKNRINQYITEHCESNSRRKKLRQTLENLYDRVSTGVHNDVAVDEAKALFLETYILLGEIIGL